MSTTLKFDWIWCLTAPPHAQLVVVGCGQIQMLGGRSAERVLARLESYHVICPPPVFGPLCHTVLELKT